MVDERRLFLEQQKAYENASQQHRTTGERRSRGTRSQRRAANNRSAGSSVSGGEQQPPPPTGASISVNSNRTNPCSGLRLSGRQPSDGLPSRIGCSMARRVSESTPPPEQAANIPSPTETESFNQNTHMEGSSDEEDQQQRTAPVEAIRVESEKTLTVALAERDSFMSSFKRSRFAQVSCIFCCILVLGLAVGFTIVFIKESMDDDDFVMNDFFDPVGTALHGRLPNGRYGSSIALNRNGTRMAVADVKDVYIYDLVEQENPTSPTPVDWQLIATIEAPVDAVLGLNSHESDVVLSSALVDLSNDGTSIVIGWPYSSNQEGLEPGTGRVEVYQASGDGGPWQRAGNIMYGWESMDYFGTSVAISEDGQQVAVGSPGNGGNAAVYVLLNQGVWVKTGNTIHLNGELLVTSVAFRGQTFALAGQSPSPQGHHSEHLVARLFRFMDFDWVELGDGLHGMFENTAYLVQVSADGNIAAMSNYYTEPWQGELNDALDVRVYEWNGAAWTQLGDNLHGFAPGEKSGYFITLSDDGKTMGMGDPGRKSEGGDSVAGHIHIYKFDDNTRLWKQLGPNRDGDAPGDQFGRSVALSGDGKHLAAGAPFNRGKGIELGRVYVFNVDEQDIDSSSSSKD